ncbi:hypothetical protein BO85DRAFT_484788 [Aspergillus piperis CBS 112811]|uniref:Uncharacterized protein n=1 Tax=Aspergillus piperis CBS 112811 TaxID=1448313 RepID=A0A8G1R9E8_9EURO|nr:hypothetical protein BO85DRAFT_484788 [Aspergillus piperis CBS 112811]RAH61036.1 hypothetical protein BO85DRAFT_484788 [Aspergillus piperis CBS 112811]
MKKSISGHEILLLHSEFDEGRLNTDLAAAEEEIEQSMALMKNDAPLISMEDNAIQHVFQSCWYRLKQSRGLEACKLAGQWHTIVIPMVSWTKFGFNGRIVLQMCEDQ